MKSSGKIRRVAVFRKDGTLVAYIDRLPGISGVIAAICLQRGYLDARDLIFLEEMPSRRVSVLREELQEILSQVDKQLNGSVRLTPREKEVLEGVLRSQANKEIGLDLNLSERTIKFHVSSLLAKFKVQSRAELFGRVQSSAVISSEKELGAQLN